MIKTQEATEKSSQMWRMKLTVVQNKQLHFHGKSNEFSEGDAHAPCGIHSLSAVFSGRSEVVWKKSCARLANHLTALCLKPFGWDLIECVKCTFSDHTYDDNVKLQRPRRDTRERPGQKVHCKLRQYWQLIHNAGITRQCEPKPSTKYPSVLAN